jgi:tetratricopeptide (TPR) repeat protein
LLSYPNIRLVRAALKLQYITATHEYIDGAGQASPLSTIWIDDRNDGGCKKNKFKRDIKLLLDELVEKPNNPRDLFYLANSYRDDGQTEKAIETYQVYQKHSNWPEECWHAQLQIADCYVRLDKMDHAVTAYLKAYELRPTRAEPLFRLAKYYRVIGCQILGLLFASTGARLPYPHGDKLFIEDYIYQSGLYEEVAICAFWVYSKGGYSDPSIFLQVCALRA